MYKGSDGVKYAAYRILYRNLKLPEKLLNCKQKPQTALSQFQTTSYTTMVMFPACLSWNYGLRSLTFLTLTGKHWNIMFFNSTLVFISYHRLFYVFTLTFLKYLHDSQGSEPTKWQPGTALHTLTLKSCFRRKLGKGN